MNIRFRKFVRHAAIVLLGAGLGLAGSASATLFDRGGGLIYDDDLDITWLQDANYAMTSGHDIDGRMNWTQAVAWAENLAYGGFDDWRLPTSLNQDGTGPCFGFNCTGSEMGHLYYTELGNLAGAAIINPGPFINLQNAPYWSGTEFAGDSDAAWNFFFLNNGDGGLQGFGLKSGDLFAWAVRPGDVGTAAVSEPGSLLLLGLGLIGLGWMGRKKA